MIDSKYKKKKLNEEVQDRSRQQVREKRREILWI